MIIDDYGHELHTIYGSPDEANRLMSVEAIAQQLNYHPTTVSGWLRDKKLKGVKLNNRWYATVEEVNKFAATHTKYKHYTLEEEAELIQQKERSEKIMSQVSAVEKGITVPWGTTVVLNEKQTSEYLSNIRRSPREANRLYTELALSLSGLPRGYSKRFTFTSKKKALYVQGFLREATELAGWYNEKDQADWPNWTAWESHIDEGVDNGAATTLTITRLTELRESRAVKIKRNKLLKTREELSKQ